MRTSRHFQALAMSIMVPATLVSARAGEEAPSPGTAGKEYHVATTGDNTNPGTKTRPFRTIQAAADIAQPGDTITVHAGNYRERINPPRGGTSDSQRITYQAAPGERVEVRGSEVVKGWSKVKDKVWKTEIPNSLFGSFNPFSARLDRLSDRWLRSKFKGVCSGAVYLDGVWRIQAPSLDRVLDDFHPERSLFHAEVGEASTLVWAQFPEGDPNAGLTEVNVRECVFYPHRPGRDYITVRGFIMRHAATPWINPRSEQPALIGTHWSKGWVIEDNVISHSIVAGISLGKYGDPPNEPALFYQTLDRARAAGWNRDRVGSHIVRNNRVSDCLSSGITGALGCTFSVIEGNLVHDIHPPHSPFEGEEIAGIKFHAPVDTLIRGNVIFRCGGHAGLWLDWMAQGERRG